MTESNKKKPAKRSIINKNIGLKGESYNFRGNATNSVDSEPGTFPIVLAALL